MSSILKAKVLSPKDAIEANIETKEGALTVFKFIGTKNNIENAKAIMDYLVNSHNELDLLMVRKLADPLTIISQKYNISETVRHIFFLT